MTYSFVAIAPVAVADALEPYLQAQGWGPGNFSVPLSADGTTPATHLGLHKQSTSQQTRDWAEGRVAVPGTDKPTLDALLQQCRFSFEPQDAAVTNAAHFNRETGAMGLQHVDTGSPS